MTLTNDTCDTPCYTIQTTDNNNNYNNTNQHTHTHTHETPTTPYIKLYIYSVCNYPKHTRNQTTKNLNTINPIIDP